MHKRSYRSGLFIVLSVFLTPWLAQAHPGSHVQSFQAGAFHPFSGWDHICAMIAVGLWAAQQGGRAVWRIPAAFVGMMLLGGILGSFGVVLPHLETGIMLSVLVLGLLVAAAVELPVAAGAMIVGLFAVFHGCAHAVEAPMHSPALSYSIGFILSTAALHLTGVGLATAATRRGGMQVVRFAGLAIAICGAVLLS